MPTENPTKSRPNTNIKKPKNASLLWFGHGTGALNLYSQSFICTFLNGIGHAEGPHHHQ